MFFSFITFILVLLQHITAQEFKTINGRVHLSGPGFGWNYLTNEVKTPIISPTYIEGATTNDYAYIIPDCVIAFDNKVYRYLGSTVMIDSGKSFQSLTARSMKVEVSGDYGAFAFSGSLSQEWTDMKSQQQTSKSVTIRNSYTADKYSLLLTTGCPLSTSFRADIEEIISNIQLNEITNISNQIKSLIDRYGTHYLSEVNIGALLYSEDEVKETYWLQKKDNTYGISAASSLSFFAKISLQASYSYSVSNQEKVSYATNTASTKVDAYGGLYTPGMSIFDWIKTIDNNLVIIDRRGNMLDTIITKINFPKVNDIVLQRLKDYLKKEITLYLKSYTKIGCMNRATVNFDPEVNANDERLCRFSETKLFAHGFGFEENTNNTAFSDNTITCLEQTFPMVTSCPKDYDVSSVISKNGDTRVTLYQCVSTKNILERNNTYLFAGFYTNKKRNYVTGAGSCPSNSISFRIFVSLKKCDIVTLCLSDYNRNPSKINAFEYGGMAASCELAGRIPSCPDGFINYYGFSVDTCAVYFCMKPKYRD